MASGLLIVQTQKDFDDWLAKQTPAPAGGGGFD
jgi:hypothetical protein